MRTLPIDAVVPEFLQALADTPSVVLEAPPGAGKTTRVPWAACEWLADRGDVLVTEPRRLAARMAAARVAAEHGQRVGERVGYSVRFEEVSGPRTRLRYVTEGVLLRRLLVDPELSGVGVVVLDEFHERHVSGDLLLVLLDRMRRTTREDLRLVVMSATLAAAPIREYLGDCRCLRSEGRLFPVEIEHQPRPDDRPLEKQIVSAVRSALRADHDGDVLVFVPGAAEIRKASLALEALAGELDLLVLPLHGDLPIAEQVRAVERAERRKVVLATNVAESSVTVEGISAVIDSGLARSAGHSPWSGLPRLITAPISRASATQRAGRAGRTRHGRVLRLYTRGDFETRPERDPPEIARADLAEALLLLHGSGVRDPTELNWLDPPDRASLARAAELLALLGAVSPAGALTPVGTRMLALPLPPRLSRLVVAGEERGVGPQAASVASLLSEREIVLDARSRFGGERAAAPGGARGSSDVLERWSRLEQARELGVSRERLRSLGLDPRAVEDVQRTARKLERGLERRGTEERDEDRIERALLRCLLAAFPDRLARRRQPGARDLVLSSGGSARLSESSVVVDAEFLLALEVEERASAAAGLAGRSAVVVRSASAVDPAWLLDDFPNGVSVRDELEWNSDAERVERVERICFGSVVLEEVRGLAESSPEVGSLLLARARASGQLDLSKSPRLTALAERLRLAREHLSRDDLPALDSGALEARFAAIGATLTSFAELRQLDLAEALLAELAPELRSLLERETPERLQLPGGIAVPVHYEAGQAPWIESRLQDFFGMAEGPRLCRGAVPVTLHLLAPNRRAVQVTSDLRGFWQRHYPAIRKQLMRRYPKHAWPEDGQTARPPERRRSP